MGIREKEFTRTAQRLAENLKTRRLIKQYTQEYLANLCGTSVTTISRIERGDVNFSVSVLLKMCQHLNCLNEVIEATDPLNTPAMLHSLIDKGVRKRAKKINPTL